MLNKLDEERLCLWPPMKLLMNNLLNFWNKVMKIANDFIWNALEMHVHVKHGKV